MSARMLHFVSDGAEAAHCCLMITLVSWQIRGSSLKRKSGHKIFEL